MRVVYYAAVNGAFLGWGRSFGSFQGTGFQSGVNVARLQVNIDHVATVRQARLTVEPDPVHAAVLAELGGATGITIHLREDRRHIQDRDVELLRKTVRTCLNLEMAATDEMVEIATRLRPEQVTLVPEKREELTTEGGLDVISHREQISAAVSQLKESGISVSLFVDADQRQIECSRDVEADAIELHTGPYAEARGEVGIRQELESLRTATRFALELSLVPHVGHGLTYQNVRPVAALRGVDELNIGHSIVSRAVMVGMELAVRDMVRLIEAVSSEDEASH